MMSETDRIAWEQGNALCEVMLAATVMIDERRDDDARTTFSHILADYDAPPTAIIPFAVGLLIRSAGSPEAARELIRDSQRWLAERLGDA